MDLTREWIVREAKSAPEDNAFRETIFAQANGYMGMRGTLDEGAPPGAPSEPYFVVQGVFDEQPGRYETDDLVNLPDPLPVELCIGDARLGSKELRVVSSGRRLEMHDGILTRELELEMRDGGRCRLSFERFVSMADRHLIVWRMRLSVSERCGTGSKLPVAPVSEAPVECLLGWGFDANRTNLGTVHFEETGRGVWGQAGLYHVIRTLQSGVTVAQAQVARAYIDGEPAEPDATELVEEGSLLRSQWTTRVASGQKLVIERVNAVCTSRDLDPDGDPLDRAQRKCAEAAAIGFDALAEATRVVWSEKWAAADVGIEGDHLAEKGLRYCLFQLMQACPEHDDRVAIGAKALSGPGYRGHFFWDTEMFMEPFFAHTNPRAARNFSVYRHRTLPESRERAESMSCGGARFPWEGTLTGREQCPTWIELPDGGEERIVTGDQEDHISADVAYGAWHYYATSGDEEFWLRYGLELMVETARFWQSRVERDEEANRFVIRRVMGPDENQKMVDNNAYTNYMAAWNLRVAAEEVAKWQKHPEGRKQLSALAVTAKERAAWERTAAEMYLPQEPSGLIAQQDGFIETAHKPNVGEPLKQADVLMLFRLFPDRFAEEVQQANWDFYEPLTAHGSSLSPSVHACVAARLGRMEQALEYFRTSVAMDLADVNGNTAEGLHAASLGGAWLAAVQGFGGFWLDEAGGVVLRPQLPPTWRRLRYRVQVRGGILHCSITRSQLIVCYDHPGDEALAATVLGERTTLTPGTRHTFATL